MVSSGLACLFGIALLSSVESIKGYESPRGNQVHKGILDMGNNDQF